MKKETDRDMPFFSNEESFIYILRSIFFNGDTINPALLQEALGISETLAIELIAQCMATVVFPDESHKKIKSLRKKREIKIKEGISTPLSP